MLKAIETRYKGYRFRSRLEARWAVFFDALAIKWEYEIEGFDLGSIGLYLPDFCLSERGYWIEIKGKLPTEDELLKVKMLALSDNLNNAFLVAGTPEEESIYLWTGKEWWAINWQGSVKNCDVWCDICCYTPTGMHPQHISSEINTCPRIRHAYEAARAARFEHGETPKVRP